MYTDLRRSDTPPLSTLLLVMCHHGMRSMQLADFLMDQGYENVKNVVGGIHAVSQIDRSIPQY
jgi:rhodanese-related sulfurtransferase